MFERKKRPFVSAVIVAAGDASRMEGIDKQLLDIGGVPVVIRSILAFEQSRKVDEIIVVTKKESIPELNRQVREFACDKVKFIVKGGDSRQQSVFCGIQCVDERCAYVAVHDGARPMVLTDAVDGCIDDAVEYGAALLAVRVKDTIKAADAQNMVERTVSRDNLYSAQTPQIFEIGLYRRAMQMALDRGTDYTDDCQLVEAAGQKVYLSQGDDSNIKITTPDDIPFAEALLAQREGNFL
ncbi:2-C-methyl-D-erythritol 4-phosphate cytidylyltransferase [Clostridiaceae bacterium NSJ-31]|uniref:2-C-methyl-D-erythritol 4-phosphate cytidylyltransferase n=1 Tax=Ligaoa zhengdingensis TaxID=2763658 RepID=A0A926DYS1_9FIRM|nr:2-C-methyl-D-erythritol 4-phosphate cytidylyltransferase [Ligaoa zhengdingensis]MBC8546069.1 2-C-methyl-D-erythritol 4-phosphate cytidylyltransferase [Ligaoa zhengdingensis]